MVDDDVEDDANRRGARVRGIHKIDQVLFGAEPRIDEQIVADVVAVVGVGFKDRREPDCRAAEARDVGEVVADAAQRPAIKRVGGLKAVRSACALHRLARLAVMEAVHHQEVDELFTPFPIDVDVALPRNRREIDVVQRERIHFEPLQHREIGSILP